ncbi:unnamed protein product [Prorocentrum cordatum]|uniref:Uncharacterized protein n=1 Tax=Prorocentrum cordatum TaxID=2364126 RepID=A0ABN9WTR8_9DINO|nr:unnamed protein product [Polarella glacialis]
MHRRLFRAAIKPEMCCKFRSYLVFKFIWSGPRTLPLPLLTLLVDVLSDCHGQSKRSLGIMESLEEYDLARVLNFRSSLKFLSLVEEELAGFVARAQQEAVVTSGRRCLMCFPPLQPKYAHLLTNL